MEGGTRAVTYTSENGSQEGWMENATRLGALLVGYSFSPLMGRVTIIVVPLPGRLLTWIDPP